jgi:N-carbamoylputrescine amidase
VTIVRVALLQLRPCEERRANLAKGLEACRRAKALGADVALFPEMWNIGYADAPADPAGRSAWREQAIGADDPWIRAHAALASELRMAIATTYLERWRPQPRNTMSLIDRHGKVVLTYAKVHTCDFGMESAVTPGEAFEVCDLDTEAGPVRVGAMICYDREFPESARLLMLLGAELVLAPNACHMDLTRVAMMRSRAAENMMGVAMANYPGPRFDGSSLAIDGVAYRHADDEEGAGEALDPLMLKAGAEEGVFVADFDLARLREYRAREVWGNAFRKPGSYARLTSPEVLPPFVRPDARR